MCFKLFNKKEVLCSPTIDEKFQQQQLQQMQVKVDGKVYLKANDLLQYIGGDSLPGVLSRIVEPNEIISILIAYKLYSQTSAYMAPLPEYVHTTVNFQDLNVHYAFDCRILPFVSKELNNDPNGKYLYEQIKKMFDAIE